MNKIRLSRRDVLSSGLGACAALGVDAVLPNSLARAAEQAHLSGNASGKRVVVVVQLTGGNDGLNTIVPITDDEYYKARPKLAIRKSDALKVTADVGFHPAMSELAKAYEAGRFAIAQGVGYERPNRSHFESMDIWHTCSTQKDQRSQGWIGQAANTLRSLGGDPFAMHLGDQKQPLALATQQQAFPSLASVEDFRLKGDARESLQTLLERKVANSTGNDLLGFIESNTSSAVVSSQRIGQAIQMDKMQAKTPDSNLAEKLSVVAQLISAGLETQIYYVQLDGFDTHARQAESHRSLLQTWSDAAASFMNQIQSAGDSDRVCLFTFSEFGRRVRENASEGTDHGAAAPAFFVGNRVNGGLLGKAPDLQDLDDGDVKFSIDFRRLYASLLDDWLQINSTAVLGQRYETLPLFNV